MGNYRFAGELLIFMGCSEQQGMLSLWETYRILPVLRIKLRKIGNKVIKFNK